MKGLNIRIVLKDDKIATAIETEGIDHDKMSDQLLLVGVYENLKHLTLQKLHKLQGLQDEGL